MKPRPSPRRPGVQERRWRMIARLRGQDGPAYHRLGDEPLDDVLPPEVLDAFEESRLADVEADS